jgi:uncharacterized membrane protein
MSAQRLSFPERLTASHRLGLSVAAALCVFAAQSAFGLEGTALLLGWDSGACVYLVLAWAMIVRSDPKETRTRARSQDLAAYVNFVVVLIAAFASIAAIALLLEGVKDLDPLPKIAHILLSVVALFSSWMLIHTIYSFHYAHRYYSGSADDDKERKGLEFPGRADPDHFDFAYYSFVVGMTSQVSDVSISGPHMRRATLVHSILSFVFNIAVLALSVNIVVSVI